MKTSKWIPGTIYALCFSVLVGVLGTCDLQKDPPPTAFYRLMATGFGDPIQIDAGYGSQSQVVDVKWHDTYQGQGWWQMDLAEERAKSEASRPYLCVQARGPNAVGTQILHFDYKGNPLPDSTSSSGGSGTMVSAIQMQASGGGGGGGGAGGGTPGPGIPPTEICAELYRQGLMPEDIFHADQLFGAYLREYQNDVLVGYKFLDKPVVSLMRKSKTFTRIVNVVAKPWTYEMAYRMGARDEGAFVGKIVMDFGVPVCRTVGRAVTWAREHRCL
ncbi:MAG: hypothetical protein ABSB63_09875 [Spirochaetia bacterium]